jgi:tetratricopeptide (TPR) repeat protein
VIALSWLASCDAEQGDFGKGLEYANEAVRIAEEADHPWSRATAYYALGGLLIAQSNLPTSIRVLERGMRLCESNDIASWRTAMAWNLGHAYTLAGDTGRGLPLLQRAINQAAADRCFAQQSLRVGWLGEVHLVAGRPQRAIELGEEALGFARARGERAAEAHILRILGDCVAIVNPQDSRPALRYYQEALSISQRLSMRVLMTKCCDAIGHIRAESHQ